MKSRPFTLLELLVTVSIIMILMSVLLPALSKSKATARSAVCLGNLRSLGTAAVLYLGESNDYFPPTIGNSTMPYFDAMENYTGVKAADSKLDVKGAGVYHCPSDAFREANAPAQRMRFSYGMNTYANASSSYANIRRSAQVRMPGALLYRADAGNFSSAALGSAVMLGTNSYPFNSGSAPDNESYGSLDFRHSSLSNVLWLDMHCSSQSLPFFYGTLTKYLYQ